MRALNSLWRHFRIAFLVTSVALLLSIMLSSLGPRVAFGLFITAVVVGAWWGGLRAAVLTTLLSGACLAVIWRWQPNESIEEFGVRLGLFVLVGLIAGIVIHQCKQAVRAVDHVHDILSGSGIAVISTDPKGRVTAMNPLARTLTGWGSADTHGAGLQQVFRLTDGKSRQPIPLPFAEIAEKQTDINLPEGALLLTKNGETVIEGTFGPVRDADGRAAGAMVIFRGAGDRTQAWQEMRQSGERFRTLAASSPSALLLLDPEGRCVFSNEASQTALGCSAEECLGEGWSRFLQAKDRDRVIADWLVALRAGQSFADEFRVQTRAGMRWLRLRSAPMRSEAGEITGHVAGLEDVTERMQAEEELTEERRLLRALSDATSDRIVVKDARGRTLLANSAARSLLGPSLDDPTWGPPSWLSGVASERFHAAEEQAIETGTPQTCEVVAEIEGRQRVFLSTKSPYRDEQGHVAGLIDVIRDVTDERRDVDELNRTRVEVARHRQAGEELRTRLDQHSAALAETRQAHEATKAEMEGRIQQHVVIQQKTEEELRRVQRILEERGVALRRAEEALQATCAEHEQRSGAAKAEHERDLEQALQALQQAEDEGTRLRTELENLAVKPVATGLAAEEREQLRAAWQQEIDAVTTMHRDRFERLRIEIGINQGETERSALAALEETRTSWAKEVAALNSARAESEASLRAELDRLRRESATHGTSVEESRAEIERLRQETQQHSDTVSSTRESWRREIEALKATHGESAEQSRSEIDRLRQETQQHEARHTNLREELARREEEAARLRTESESALRATQTRSEEALAQLREQIEKARQSAEESRRQREFLEAVIDGNPDGIFAHDREGRCVIWNSALERLLARAKDQAVGRTAIELFPTLNENHPGILSLRIATGEVIGGMAIIRVRAERIAAPEANGKPRKEVMQALHDHDWLAFN
jgi:PAS domain S-box-containing protein